MELEDIKPLTNQEAFDLAVRGLRKQGRKSMLEGGSVNSCLYRLDKTALCEVRCGIGHVIPDEIYDAERMETHSVGTLIDESSRYYCSSLANLLHFCSSSILGEIQNIHDRSPPENWERRFSLLAQKYNLVYVAKDN